jgi:hypothetical protein
LGRAGAAIAAALLGLALLPSALFPSAWAEVTDVRAAHVVATLEPDGVLDLLHRLDVAAGAPPDTEWEVTMRQGELFAEPSLHVNGRRYVAGDGRRAGTFRISRGTRGVRFEWPQPPGPGGVRMAYRLALLGTAYSDVVDLRVPVWDGNWPVDIRELTAVLRLPRSPHGRVFAWIEPGSRAATIARTGRDVRLRMRDLPGDDAVTLHVVFPRSVLSSSSGVTVEERKGLASILADRRGDESVPWWTWALAGALVLVVSVAALRTARRRRPRPR